MSEVQSILKSVSFKDLENWSVSHLLKDTLRFNKKYQVVKLKEILSKADIEWVNIEDDKKYPILGVHSQGQGVYINRIAIGNELTMRKYQKSKAFHLFYCKVRTVKGQWGVVYPKYENSYASSNMQYLKINLSKIIPEFLENLLKIKRLTDLWDQNAIGADGRHFNKNILLNLEIPLPSLQQQEELIQDIFYYEKSLKDLENNYKQLINDFNQSIFSKKVKENENLLNFINYQDLGYWSVSSNLENNFNHSNNYPLVKISDFLRRNKTQIIVQDDIEYKRVTIKINNGGVFLRDKKLGKEIGTKKQFLIKKGQFLLSKIDARNGAFGLATDEVDGAIITADFFAYNIDIQKINPQFLVFITTTRQFKEFAQSASNGTTNRQRINEDKFLNVKIPLPSLEEQNKLIAPIIENLEQQKEAQKNKEEAIKEFEREIFDEA